MASDEIDRALFALNDAEQRLLGDQSAFDLQFELESFTRLPVESQVGSTTLHSLTLKKKGRSWFASRVFTHPGKKQSRDGTEYEDPAEPWVVIHNNGEVFDWQAGSSYAAVNRFDRFDNFLIFIDFFRFVGANSVRRFVGDNAPGKNYRDVANAKHLVKDGNWPWLPDELAEHMASYKVNRRGELVVLMSDADEICLDPAKSYCIVERRVRYGADKPIRIEIKNGDFHQVGNGLWLPFRVTETLYASVLKDPPEVWGQPVEVRNYVVRQFSMDSVADSDFHPKLPVGLRVGDGIRGIQYEVTDATSPFSDDLETGRKILKKEEVKKSWRTVGFLLTAGALSLLAGGIYFRFRQF